MMIENTNRPPPVLSLFDFGPIAEHYNLWYETPQGRLHDRTQKEDVRRILPPAHAGEKLLDVGCGSGHWSRFFVSMGYQVYGIDISPEMVQVAQSSVPSCSFEVADASDLPFSSEIFDVVAAMATLEFVTDPRLALKEMARCTRPGGTILVGSLNKNANINQKRVEQGKEPYASGRLLSSSQLCELLSSWGVVSIVGSPVLDIDLQSPTTEADKADALSRKPDQPPFLVAKVRK